jgi:hypothetical protein
MSRPIAKLLGGFVIAAALIALGAVIWTLSQPGPPPVPLPHPNGYDDFVNAGRLATDNGSNYLTLGEEELHALVRTNAEALKLARIGLSHETRVPMDYSATNATRFEQLPAVKRLARAFAAEGRLAEVENRPGDAARSYVDAIRLGYSITQGGVIIDSLVGIAIQAIGILPLEKLVPALDAKRCRALAAELESAESRRQSMATLLAQEHAWARRTYGLKGQFAGLVMYKTLRQTEQRFASRLKGHQIRMRKLLIQLAARAYEQEKGDRPKSLADLVPGYLKAIPQDPLTGTNMACQP